MSSVLIKWCSFSICQKYVNVENKYVESEKMFVEDEKKYVEDEKKIEKLKLATKLDDLVGNGIDARHWYDMNVILEMEVSSFNRIVIQIESESLDSGLKRSVKPTKYYAHLQAQVESWHPEYTCMLSVPNTKEIVGSQFELLCAYQDSTKDILTLDLTLHENVPSPSATNVQCVQRRHPVPDFRSLLQSLSLGWQILFSARHKRVQIGFQQSLLYSELIEYNYSQDATIQLALASLHSILSV
ncbi:hypothetical protein BC833DRAFT_640516 [Globomyces pollinis-pini]|nr:hypothetical protein BC833DRAFT_640516 [Globomyces pollinis-pini]